MFKINANQVGGILRAVLPPLVAFIAAKGWISAQQVDAVVTAIVTLVIAAWSFQTNQEDKPK